jgi:hypothetical protein
MFGNLGISSANNQCPLSIRGCREIQTTSTNNIGGYTGYSDEKGDGEAEN